MEALVLEQAAEAAPEEVVVVDQQHAQLFELLPGGPIVRGWRRCLLCSPVPSGEVYPRALGLIARRR
jgi:hypothetical protein